MEVVWQFVIKLNCFHVKLNLQESSLLNSSYLQNPNGAYYIKYTIVQRSERKYAQIEKEGLAIIFGLKIFNMYLFGTHFTSITDYKPLMHIFGRASGIPLIAAAWMQQWALILSGYQYQIQYRSSVKNANADLLSRLPVGDPIEADPDENCVFKTVSDTLPITALDIARLTAKDSVLSRVYEYTMSGWPGHCSDPSFQPYFTHRHELSVEDGCILWGRRVVIPSGLQHNMLSELHECHTGWHVTDEGFSSAIYVVAWT